MLDTPCSEVVWRVLATHSIRIFPLHFPTRASPCAIIFHVDSTFLPIPVEEQLVDMHRKMYLTLGEWKVCFSLTYSPTVMWRIMEVRPYTPLCRCLYTNALLYPKRRSYLAYHTNKSQAHVCQNTQDTKYFHIAPRVYRIKYKLTNCFNTCTVYLLVAQWV